MNSTPFAHADLVRLAAKWLSRKHSVVLTELVTSGETPDAIGWQGTHSTLIECKVSLADFAADANKLFRKYEEMGVGSSRYFLAPKGLLYPDRLPLKWGLLEVDATDTREAVKSGHFEACHRHEVGILLSTLRRIGHNAPSGVSIRCYTIGTKNNATLSLWRDNEKEQQ